MIGLTVQTRAESMTIVLATLLGATNPNASGQLLPDLKGIIDFKIDKINNKVYVSDPLGNKIYEIKTY